MSSKYLQSIQEVRQWLSYKKLDEFIYILLDNGYDDLDSISQCTPQEVLELESLFQTPETKKNIQILVESLRQVGIDAYRKQKSEFRRLTQFDEVQNGPQIRMPNGSTSQPNSAAIGGGAGRAVDPSVNEQAVMAHQQAQRYLEQARSQLVGKTGYCAVRSSPTTTWSDKYVALEGTDLRWFTSRRDQEPEIAFSLMNLLTAVDKPDPTTIVLSLSNNSQIELGYDNTQETDEWFIAFASVIPVAQAALIVAQHAALLQQVNASPSPMGASGSYTIGSPQSPPQQSPLSSSPSSSNMGSGSGGGASNSSSSMSPSSSTGASVLASLLSSGDEQKFDVSNIQGAIGLHAYFRAMLTLTRTVVDAIAEDELEKKIIGSQRQSANNMKQLKANLKTLSDGCQFKKFKRGNSAKRLIWCTPLFDYVLWGSEDKQDVKGFISTREIQEINQGFGKNKCRLYVVSPSRTLELEARDANVAKEWKDLFEFLIQSCLAEQEQKRVLYSKLSIPSMIQSLCVDYSRLLTEGDVFKKWPAKKTIQKGSFTSRKIWASPNVDRLQWGDIVTKKVMGFLLMQDVVHIQEDTADKVKFTIYAQKRSLDLEAKSVWVREKWVRALRFFAEFKQKH